MKHKSGHNLSQNVRDNNFRNELYLDIISLSDQEAGKLRHFGIVVKECNFHCLGPMKKTPALMIIFNKGGDKRISSCCLNF